MTRPQAQTRVYTAAVPCIPTLSKYPDDKEHQ
jgi:hypothetical protein